MSTSFGNHERFTKPTVRSLILSEEIKRKSIDLLNEFISKERSENVVGILEKTCTTINLFSYRLFKILNSFNEKANFYQTRDAISDEIIARGNYKLLLSGVKNNQHDFNDKVIKDANKFVKDFWSQPSDKVIINSFKVNYDDDKIKSCLSVYRNLTWLKDRIDFIYVNPISLPDIFYDTNTYVDYMGERYHSVTTLYYRMRCLGEETNISDSDVLTIEYENNIYSFKVGFKPTKGNFVVQTKEMFVDEKNYVNTLKNTNINIVELKNGKITEELKIIAISSLEDFTPSRTYAENIIKNVENNSENAYEFAYGISKIINSAQYSDNIFSKRLKKGYYNEDIIHLLDYNVLMEGVVYDSENFKSYVEDSATNIILYSSQYYNIPERKYKRDDSIKYPNIKKLDVRIKCDNIEKTKNIPEENLTFYEYNNKIYCYDISQLYFDFDFGIFTDQDTGVVFSKDFVDKIRKMYSFKIANLSKRDSNTSEDYDDVINRIESLHVDPEFVKVLELVRKYIDDIKLSLDKCATCKKNVGRMGIITIDSTKGDVIKHCSRYCFEKN